MNVKDSDTLPLANNIYLDTTTPVEYNLYIWIRENEAEQERLMGGSLSGKIQVTGTEKSTDGIVNEGVLASGMIPVVYDEENDVWVKAGGDYGWYDYDNQMWANAVIITSGNPLTCIEWDGVTGDVTLDGELSKDDSQKLLRHTLSLSIITDEEALSRADADGDGTIDANDVSTIEKMIVNYCNSESRVTALTAEEYLAAEPGTPINSLMISYFYTWIPRYKYKINNTGTSVLPSAIDVVFESGVTSTGVDINTDGVAVTEYYTHPSFRDGSSVYKTTAYDQSGWDSELFGYWVQKFEAYGGPLSTKNQSTRLDNEFSIYTKKKSNMYGMKNTQWGAVAYLSQSKYGKMGNSNFTGANKEIYINSNSNLYSGRSGGNVDASAISTGDYNYNGYKCKTYMCTETKDALKGTGASTTGNVYGVYDMNGGAKEYVMATYNNLIGSSLLEEDYFTDESNKKYYDSYDSTKTYILGDATYETSGWYNDMSISMTTDNPFLIRGGLYNDGISAGIFNYENLDGSFYSDVMDFRIVMIIK